MKLLKHLWVTCCTAALLGTASAEPQRTASIKGSSQSLYFGGFNHYDTSGRLLSTFLTTYDGRTDVFPLNQRINLNSYLFSGELRPRASEPGNYEADYASYTTALNPPWKEYGSFVVTLPTDDTDGNGLPDICRSNKAVNVSTTGALYVDWQYPSGVPTTDGLILTMSRGINQLVGSYTIRLSSEGTVNGGNFQLLNVGGSVSYTRSTAAITFNFAISDPPSLGFGGTRTVTGSTTYTVLNANQIVLPQFSVTGGGATYTFQSGCTLNRTGARYVGSATLVDGLPDTGWADATSWVIEINDPNDWDGNGIPDISDAIPTPPFIISNPQSRTAVLSSNTSFSVSFGGSMPLSYQWQLAGTNLPGATSATLNLTNVQFASAGDYRAIASNGGGSATSQVATLTVIFPPSITDQPVGGSVIAGQSAQLNVAAIGTDPLYYQWRHETTNVPGATDPILYIAHAQPQDAGQYSVVVSNAAGIAISSTVILSVVIPPAITNQPQSQSVKTNVTVTFNVGATGTGLQYRWLRNGTNVPGGNFARLTLNNVRADSGGIFSVIVSNSASSVRSANATLYVGWPVTLTNFVRDASGTVRADLIGLPGDYIFQSSSNLTDWVSLTTNNAPAGLTSFSDSADNGESRRFYRAKVK